MAQGEAEEETMKTKLKKISPGAWEVLSITDNSALGRIGGREGSRWAQAADGSILSEDSPCSARVMRGLVESNAKKTDSGGIQP